MIIQLPAILPGELNLVEINKKLRQHQIILDWSSVISAPESQLEILLEGIDSVEDVDWLGINGEISDHIAADINNYIKTHTKTEEQQPILSSNIPSAYKIREELEAAIIADLLGPAGGENEELDEKSVSDRYLVGLLAPQHRRITEETIEKSSVVNQISKDDNADNLDDKLDDNLREVDCYLPGNNDELAISGKGTVEDGSTEVNILPASRNYVSIFSRNDILC